MTFISKFPTSVLPAAALAIFCATHQASAAGKTWNSSGTDFNTGSNWSASGVPGSTDHIVFATATTGTNPNLSSATTIQQILFSDAASSGWTISGSTMTLTSPGTGATPGTGAAIYALNTSGTNTISANLVLGATSVQNQRFDVTTGGTLLISGTISGNIGTLVKGGNGTISLTGSNTFSATISISNGTLQVSNNAALGNSANGVTLAGGILKFGSAFDLSERSVNISAGTSRLDTNGFDVTLANSIGGGGAGTLRKDGAGTLTLSGSNNYTGGTTINAGAVAIGHNSALGTGTASITGAVTLRSDSAVDRVLANAINLAHTGATTIGDGGNLTFGAMTLTNATANTLTVNNAVTTVASIGEDAGGRKFTKAGTGALVATGDSNFTGATQINGGVFAVRGTFNHTGNLGLNGGVMGLNGTYSKNLGTSGNQVQWLANAAGGFAAIGANNTWGHSANNLTVNIGGSASTLTFGSTNFIASGRALILGAAVSNGTVTWQNGLNLAGANQTVQVNRSTVVGAGVDAIITGVISNGSLTKTGDGILSLGTKDNLVTQNYAGATLVNAGTLLINGSVGNGGITVASGAKLGGEITAGGTTTIQSGATLAVGNSAGLGTFASLSLSGLTEIEINAGADASGRGTTYDAINVTSEGGLTYGGTLKLVFAGTVTDTGAFDLFDFVGTTHNSFTDIVLFAGETNIGSLTFTGGVWGGTFDLGYGSGMQSFTFSESTGGMTVIPEPSTWALIGLGLAFAIARKRQLVSA